MSNLNGVPGQIRTEVHGHVLKIVIDNVASQDAREGIQSFVERRAAVFHGRLAMISHGNGRGKNEQHTAICYGRYSLQFRREY
jgi:hypothetical protein